MKNLSIVFVILMIGILAVPAWATNGDNLIAIGPVARAMGGVGIAAPQDAISSVFANPAAMNFAPFCTCTEFDFAGTLFMPHVQSEIINANGTINATSSSQVYAIPAIGLSVPMSKDIPLRFGIAAYGASGLGVDYRGTSLDTTFPNGYPLIAGTYTQLMIMKFAPAISYKPSDKLSVGIALQTDYSSLDLRNGGSSNYGYGAQLGVIVRPIDVVTVGLTYLTPQQINYKNVLLFGSTQAELDLTSPQTIGFGVAYESPGTRNVLVEGNVKWVNWAGAGGYKDFDWKDQWVFAIGAQVKPIEKLYLRAGFNYAKSPLSDHNGFNGTGSVNVQGTTMPTYYYETFRVIGFPAVVESHLTFGVGYDFTPDFGVHLGYMYAFENNIIESGTNIVGQPVTLQSKLSESSMDFGLTWKF